MDEGCDIALNRSEDVGDGRRNNNARRRRISGGRGEGKEEEREGRWREERGRGRATTVNHADNCGLITTGRRRRNHEPRANAVFSTTASISVSIFIIIRVHV